MAGAAGAGCELDGDGGRWWAVSSMAMVGDGGRGGRGHRQAYTYYWYKITTGVHLLWQLNY